MKKVLLIGNPNCGKTALFNALTNSRQRVGNWPGVTVSCKTGVINLDTNISCECADLPGVYSLAQSQTNALDHQIALRYLLSCRDELIINICDAANLERNLYLTSQLCQLKRPMIMAVNMTDIAAKQNITLDYQKLSKKLGIPVIPIIANREHGLKQLKAAISNALQQPAIPSAQPSVPDAISSQLQQLQQFPSLQGDFSSWQQWAALENDSFAKQRLSESESATLKKLEQEILSASGEASDTWIADQRYRWANDLAKQVRECKQYKTSISEKIDKIVLNKFLGIPIFLGVMYMMFVIAINLGGALQDFFDIGSDTIFVSGLANFLGSIHAPAWLIALLCNGIGKGINTTITFIPVIGMMFLCLSYLEDSGYLARAAFLVDRLMQLLGLPGKALVPMIVGFGCNVPAVMGARTLEHKRDRILTIMMAPFVSCGARLAIFAVFVAAFFPRGGQNLIFSLYMLGIAVAIFTAWLLRKTVLSGKSEAMVMEMPLYHRPHLRSIWRHTWARLKQFIFRAGKVIVPVCLALGFLNHITPQGTLLKNTSQKSLLAQTGRVLTPIFTPLGIKQENWPATVGLLTGVMAKEVVIGSLNSLYAQVGGYDSQTNPTTTFSAGLMAALQSVPDNLRALPQALSNPIVASAADDSVDAKTYGMLRHEFASATAAVAYLLFILLYFPCISTMAAVKRELGSKWMWIGLFWNTISAYAIAVFYFQINKIIVCPVWAISCTFLLVPIAYELLKRLLFSQKLRGPADVA